MEELFSLIEVKSAYRKFKSWAYYDSSSLVIFDRIAEYERKKRIEMRLTNFLTALNEGNVDKYLKDTDYYVLPKKVTGTTENKDEAEQGKAFFYSNEDETYATPICETDHYNFMIDATVEQQLIAVLWLMNVGVYLQNEDIEDLCYGNILCINKNCKDGRELESGVRLFYRYFDKYSQWRDQGIRCGRRIVEKEKNNALLISLDVKRFYPSSNIDFQKLVEDTINAINLHLRNLRKRERMQKKAAFLNECLEKLLSVYNRQIGSERMSLPIGLACSGVIANWYLSEFDKKMVAQFTPAYYGRYVDDIFMVIPNVMGKDVKDWWYAKCRESGTPLELKEQDGRDSFVLKGYGGNMKVNEEKLKLFFFSYDHPLALLENFQKQIEDNSSIFWLYSDDEENDNENFDNASYDVEYEDTIFSFRSVKGIRLSKFRLSAFLAKKLKQAITTGKGDSKLKEYIFKTFKGCNLLNFYSQWEKLFSYFVITDDADGVLKLKRLIADTVSGMLVQTDNELANSKLKDSILSHAEKSLIMAFTLNTDMMAKTGEEVFIDQVIDLRYSYLVRAKYLPISAVLYYDETCYITNISSPNVIFEVLKAFEDGEKKEGVGLVPRHVSLYEICIMEMLREIACFGDENTDMAMFKRDSYIKACMDKYHNLNVAFDGYNINCKPAEKHLVADVSAFDISSSEDEESCTPKGVLFGLSNVKVDQKDILNKIIGHPSNLSSSKRKRYISLLNKAIEEHVDCLLLPECYLPIEWLPAYAADAGRKRRFTVTGLEHFIYNNYCYNIAVAMIPFQFKGVPISEVLLLPRLKNFYSPTEERTILQYRHKVPRAKKAIYDVITWNGIRYTVFNCFELANINHRGLFKSQIDIMLAVEMNSDTNYYGNIAEATCRDLHCYFIQSNTSEYGDSRVVVPKKTEEMNPVRVKGGENDTILTMKLDIGALRLFQSQDPLYQQPKDEKFKPIPPGFRQDTDEKNAFAYYWVVTPECQRRDRSVASAKRDV